MVKKSKVNQHIVPQSYLKNFANKNSNNDGYYISVYHRNSGKVFKSAIKDVAFEKNYYDVSNRENEKHWEDHFAQQIEPMYGQELRNIIARITLSYKKINILEEKHLIQLSKMIGFQFVRVPGFLERRFEHGSELFDMVIKDTRERFSNSNVPNLEDLLNQFIFKKNKMVKDMTLELISQEERLRLFSNVLKNKSWIIYYNNSDLPFMTSDNPVLMLNFRTKSIGYSDNGLGRNDNIIYFPLSNRILLELVPKNEETLHLDNSLNILTNDNLKFITTINFVQVLHAEKQSFIHPNYQGKMEEVIESLKSYY